MPPSGSRSTELAGRSAAESTMSRSATPGSEEEPSDGSEHSGDGTRLPACGRIATEHECFERHGDEADRHHDDEVPERTGRTSHPEMVDP